MKASVETKLGNVVYRIEIDGKPDMETLHQIAILGNPPTSCDNCKNEKVEKFRLTSNKDKDANTYVNVECLECGAKAKLGLYRSGGYFWHKFEVYTKNAN
jgi:hypothetical protein